MAGRQRPSKDASNGYTLRECCNEFLISKQSELDARKISPRTYAEYHQTTDRLIRVFGIGRFVTDIRPDDCAELRRELIKTHTVNSLARAITMSRSVFKHAFDADKIARPIKFGPDFNVPSKAEKRNTKRT